MPYNNKYVLKFIWNTYNISDMVLGIDYKRTSVNLWGSQVEKRSESNKRKNMIAFKTIILYYIHNIIYKT